MVQYSFNDATYTVNQNVAKLPPCKVIFSIVCCVTVEIFILEVGKSLPLIPLLKVEISTLWGSLFSILYLFRMKFLPLILQNFILYNYHIHSNGWKCLPLRLQNFHPLHSNTFTHTDGFISNLNLRNF